jgi:hypothetical protein
MMGSSEADIDMATPTRRSSVQVGLAPLTVHRGIAATVAAGEPWTSKRLRADYLWRILTPAGTRATPHGWLGHVTVAPVRRDGRWIAYEPLPVFSSAARRRHGHRDLRRNPRPRSTPAEAAVYDSLGDAGGRPDGHPDHRSVSQHPRRRPYSRAAQGPAC